MPIAWFICGYKRKDRQMGSMVRRCRYCQMDDFTSQIVSDGGSWSEAEVLGGYAVVKVSASDSTLSTIAGTAGFQRLPKNLLTSSLSDLTTAQKNAIRNKLEDMGYSLSEIKDALGTDIGSKTLADVLRFAAKRRLKPRYDAETDAIVCDGAEQPVRSIDDVDRSVK